MSHESSFRQTDADGNGLKDYWTADVAGFYVFEQVEHNRPRYVDIQLVKADTAPIRKAHPSLPPETLSPKAGYLYQALLLDENGSPYRQDPDGDGNNYTNTRAYAFCAFPASYGDSGARTFIVNEKGVVYGKDTGGKPVTQWPGKDPLELGWQRTGS